MNIFAVHTSPGRAAKFLCDRHVTKMPTESVQILSTVIRLRKGTPGKIRHPSQGWIDYDWVLPDERPVGIPTLSLLTHPKHPCVIWAGESEGNFRWLYKHAWGLIYEAGYRWPRGASHDSSRFKLKRMALCYPVNELGLRHKKRRGFALAVPPQYLTLGDPVAIYRAFYLGEKLHFKDGPARWTRRNPPSWITESPQWQTRHLGK